MDDVKKAYKRKSKINHKKRISLSAVLSAVEFVFSTVFLPSALSLPAQIHDF